MNTPNNSALTIFGRGSEIAGSHGLFKMEEITFSADPKTLREIAKFIIEAAEAKEQSGNKWSHRHLQDEWDGFKDDFSDVIVA